MIRLRFHFFVNMSLSLNDFVRVFVQYYFDIDEDFNYVLNHIDISKRQMKRMLHN